MRKLLTIFQASKKRTREEAFQPMTLIKCACKHLKQLFPAANLPSHGIVVDIPPIAQTHEVIIEVSVKGISKLIS